MLSFSSPRWLSANEQRRLPSRDESALYQERGWHVTEPILPAGLLDAATRGVERYLQGERDASVPSIARRMDWNPECGQTIRIYGYLSLQMTELRELVSFPLIGAIAAVLARTDEIRLFHDRLIVKPGGLLEMDTETGWHTDCAYWQTSTSEDLLTAWIPLHDCDAFRGTLAVVDGSHRWPSPCLERRFLTPDMGGLVPPDLVPDGAEVNPVTLAVERGQVVYHHCRLLHRSVPNRSENPRIALAVHLQDEGNRYQHFIQPNGRLAVHTNDLLCRRAPSGLPDYRDPMVFPVLFRATTSSEPVPRRS